MCNNPNLRDRNQEIRNRYLELRGQRFKKADALKKVVDECAEKNIKISPFTVTNIVSDMRYSNSPITPLVKEAS